MAPPLAYLARGTSARAERERRLADAPRRGAVPRLTAEQVSRLWRWHVSSQLTRPTGQSMESPRLGGEIVRHGITDRISPNHAVRLVRKGPTSNRIECGNG